MKHTMTYKQLFALTHTLVPWGGSKSHFSFLKVVMFHIKLTGMKQRTQCKQIFCPFIHPQSMDEVKRPKYFFLKKVMLHDLSN